MHTDKFKPKGAKIHSDKFDGEIFYQLKEIGLAKKEDDDWYIVETQTASFLMTFLATVISSKLNIRPITDQIKTRQNNHHNLDRRRDIILRELIPVPSTINLDKLRRFKEKHYELLRSFKNRAEEILLDDSIDEETELFKYKSEELRSRKT